MNEDPADSLHAKLFGLQEQISELRSHVTVAAVTIIILCGIILYSVTK